MHQLEPHFRWRLEYTAETDQKSPFYGREYSEFEFSQKVYNYYIHPQWDEIGSETLYAKILYANYADEYAIIELIGEWNDCINNDIMILKDNLIDPLQNEGICKFILIGENVLNFHGSDDSYYEEWYNDVADEGGWICLVGMLDHVLDEMEEHDIQHYVNLGHEFNIIWRPQKPQFVYEKIRGMIEG
jgi:hypothetical protein